MSTSFIVIFGGLYLIHGLLLSRQLMHIGRQKLPDDVLKYNQANLTHFARTQMVKYFIAMFAYLGGFMVLNQMFLLVNLSREYRDVLLVFSVVMFYSALALCMSYWQVFWVDKKHGFSSTSKRLFFLDQLKKFAVNMSLAMFAVQLVAISGPMWWLSLWLLAMALLTMASRIHFWLFDRLTPLGPGALYNRIQELAKACHYETDKIFVVDRSTRSKQANAYFTGFGRNKRIVFDDTLMDQLDDDALLAVCAHELGHCHYRHERKYFTLLGGLLLFALLVVDRVVVPTWFGLPLDGSPLLVVLVCAPIVMFLLQPLTFGVMRRYEWQADEFAKAHVAPEQLRSALEKLSVHNKMVRSADPVYVWFFYSHPPIAERLAALGGVLER